MAGKGAAPKAVLSRADAQARREAEGVKVSADGVLRGPDLPDGDWHPRTLAWWSTWQRSPQAQTFIDTDWDALSEAALLHTRMWNGEVSVAAELRLRTAKFGSTPEDRLRMRMTIGAEVETIATSMPLIQPDRRRRLLRAVNDGA